MEESEIVSDSDGSTAMITVEMRAFLSDFSCSTPTLHLLAPILFWPGEVTYSELLGAKRVQAWSRRAIASHALSAGRNSTFLMSASLVH